MPIDKQTAREARESKAEFGGITAELTALRAEVRELRSLLVVTAEDREREMANAMLRAVRESKPEKVKRERVGWRLYVDDCAVIIPGTADDRGFASSSKDRKPHLFATREDAEANAQFWVVSGDHGGIWDTYRIVPVTKRTQVSR